MPASSNSRCASAAARDVSMIRCKDSGLAAVLIGSRSAALNSVVSCVVTLPYFGPRAGYKKAAPKTGDRLMCNQGEVLA